MNKRVDMWLTMIQSCNLSFSIINLSGKTWETARNDFFPLGKRKKKKLFFTSVAWDDCLQSGRPTHLAHGGLAVDGGSCLTAQHICSRGNSESAVVSDIANQCLLCSACSDWSLRGSSKWQRMKKWCKSCIIHHISLKKTNFLVFHLPLSF